VRIAIVVTRYGEDVLGGGEYHMRQLAEHLLARGHMVTVLTTCARNHYTWANELPAGPTSIRGVPVHRYPVTIPRDQLLVGRLQLAIDSGMTLPAGMDEEWVRNTGYSEPLLEAIDRIADSVDAIVFGQYLFAATVHGARVRPERSLIQPFLHDEPYARFPSVQATMRGAAGILWISAAERELGEGLIPGIPDGRVVGAGVDLPQHDRDTAAERRRLGLDGAVVSYAGRRERAKNFPLVAEAVTVANLALKRETTLLAMGGGPAFLPWSARPFVRDLGRVSDGDMLSAFAASTAVANLSLMESFSYVVMEAWSVATPVIVHADCAVTRRHCEDSGGGIWVRTVEEAAEAIVRLDDQPGLRRALGAAGRRYVERQATWPVVMDRMEAALAGLLGVAPGSRRR
jgi:glycosyltransferase involved in cell wall biosynthesis